MRTAFVLAGLLTTAVLLSAAAPATAIRVDCPDRVADCTFEPEPPCEDQTVADCIGFENPCEGQTFQECTGIDPQEMMQELQDFLDEDSDNDGIHDSVEGLACTPAFQDEIATGGQMHCAARDDLVLHPSTNPVDGDGDGVPDSVEQVVCGPAVVRNNLGPSTQVYCTSPSDLTVSPDPTVVTGPVNYVLGVVLGLLSPLDQDGDLVLDDAEPWICQVENPNFSQDGSCNAALTDYTPPA